MLLTIDVGNSNMVFGLFEGNQLAGSFRLMSDSGRTSDELGFSVCDYFNRFNLKVQDVDDVIISSVAPRMMNILNAAMVKYLNKKPLVIYEDIHPVIPCEVSGQLGADRAVSCIAAMEKYGAPLIILDFGTATTIDALSKEGNYLGGCILAGLKTSNDALFKQAAMLPQIELVAPDTVLGLDTITQIQIGSILGYIGGMKYLVERTKEEMGCGDEVKVIGEGGLVHLVAGSSDFIDIVDDNLILDGLRILYERFKKGEQC